MAHEPDPMRLLDPDSGASERLRTLLREGVEDLPTPQEIRALEARMAPLLWPDAGLGGPLDAGAGAGSAGATASGTGLAKVAAGIVAASVVAGGVWFTTADPAPVRQETPKPATRAAPTERLVSPPEQRVPEPKAKEPVLSPTESPTRKGPEKKSLAPKLSEADLLYAARAALNEDPKRALWLVEKHRRQFPSGVLTQEREVIGIEALSRLGRSDDAAERGERFKSRYPESAHKSKIDGIVRER